ncbi:hypothetical protein ACEPAF_25 [Sanghuangporus sanghuang]
MHSLAPLPYSLEETSPVPWNESAESQLHRDYPFLNQDNSDQDFVIRRYLETLWLPEAFTPLSYLIYSLRRFFFQNSDENSIPHPLHSLLEPILLSTRAASDKYRTELVQILADGGGAGEQEEMMMWYTWEYEKTENGEDGTIDEEKWRKAWLERLERREVMIQILLLMLKLSIPGMQLSLTGKKGKKKKNKKQELPPEAIEDRLESYMDKLAVWQLTGTLESLESISQSVSLNHPKAKEDIHWTQFFYEDVVAPLFKTELPEQCELLRSKLFPEQIVSDAEESEAESLLNGRASRAGSRAPSVPRVPHTRAPSMSRLTGPQLQRSRSRSLSVSLAQDEASQRACIVAPKQSLSREVSMSRVFKEKPKAVGRLMSYNDVQKQEPLEKPRIKRDVGMTLVQETPVKRKHLQTAGNGEAAWDTWRRRSESRLAVPSPPATSSSEPGDVCIEDTPVATRVRQVDEVAIDALSPLTPLPDDAPSTMNSAADNVKTRGRKASALKNSLASSRKPRRQLYKPPAVMGKPGHDEHSDESFIDAFKLSKVSLLEGDDNRPMLVSPSPATRIRRGSRSGLGDGMKGAGLFGKLAEDMGMTTPTKRRTRRQ